VQVDIAPEAPKLAADERLLIQSLVYCLELALEAVPGQGTLTLEVTPEQSTYHFRLHDPRPYPPEAVALLQTHFTMPLRVLLQQHTAIRAFLSRFILRAHGGLLTLLPTVQGGVTFDLSVPRPERIVPVILRDAAPLFEET
jgi:signal transduction histidine kinase